MRSGKRPPIRRAGHVLVAASAVFATLAGCASPQQQAEARQARAAERTLDRIGSIGDPGRVAAADFAFARMAREQGQWTAFREYAAPAAVIHGQAGPLDVREWLSGRADPERSVAWEPSAVWASCDGTQAVSIGRFNAPAGIVGDYVTVWELQADRSYLWVYDIAVPDDPQPPAPPPPEERQEGDIVVEGLRSIDGRVADCPQEGIPLPPPPQAAIEEGARVGGSSSRDGSLGWTWVHTPAGLREVTVLWYREGRWQRAYDLSVPPASE